MLKVALHAGHLRPGPSVQLALITTTIYVPRVLERYRELNKDVLFFIAGDRKTPHDELRSLASRLGNAVYYSDTDQEKLGYRSSELIGWNRIMRRNIALLEAIKYGADIIITVDDDNIPLGRSYFAEFARLLTQPFSGLQVSSDDGWFNIGEYMIPRIYHRGFPYDRRHMKQTYVMHHVRGVKVGVAAGLWLGDPDVDAMERITNHPEIHQVAEAARRGVCVDPDVFAPVNSQNTAYVAEVAPLFMVWTGVGRYDDIWASYVAQRIMRTLGYHVYYGPPFVWQQRNPQNLWDNLRDELFGMEHTTRFCKDLLAAELGEGTVLDKLERLYEQLEGKDYLPPIVCELGKAWCEDIRGIQGYRSALS